MNKTNNSKEPTWQEIEKEFHKQFDSKTYDFYQGWTFDEIDEILSFFKPYFQEKMHEISLRELEEEHPLYKKEYNELPEIVDNNPKE